jgi:hypothetical protein
MAGGRLMASNRPKSLVLDRIDVQAVDWAEFAANQCCNPRWGTDETIESSQRHKSN